MQTTRGRADPERRQRRLALVDDDQALRGALVFALETDGYSVESFESGESLLASDLTGVDCYIIDHHRLSGMSGMDLIGKLRANNIAAPAIIMTTNPSIDLVRRAAALGVPIVEKPLMGSVLAQTVHDMIQSAR